MRATPRSTVVRRFRRKQQLEKLGEALSETRALAWLSFVWLLGSIAFASADWLGRWQELQDISWAPSVPGFTLGWSALGVALAVQLVAWVRSRSYPASAAFLHLVCVWLADFGCTGQLKIDGVHTLVGIMALVTIWSSLRAERVEVANGELDELLESKTLAESADELRKALEATKHRRSLGWVEVACALSLAWAALPLFRLRAPHVPAAAIGHVAWVLENPQIKLEILAERFVQPGALELAAQLRDEVATRGWKRDSAADRTDAEDWPARYVRDRVEVRLGEDNPLVLALALEGDEWRVASWRWDERSETRR